MMSDSQLEDAIIVNLENDPRIPSPTEIAVRAHRGIVTLRGTVESLRQRRAAVEDTQKLIGVYEVNDELKVSFEGKRGRSDDEIRGVALQTLIWNTAVPAHAVDAKVRDGWVTLTGTVRYQSESDAAYDDMTAVPGVRGITNEIRVVTPRGAAGPQSG